MKELNAEKKVKRVVTLVESTNIFSNKSCNICLTEVYCDDEKAIIIEYSSKCGKISFYIPEDMIGGLHNSVPFHSTECINWDGYKRETNKLLECLEKKNMF